MKQFLAVSKIGILLEEKHWVGFIVALATGLWIAFAYYTQWTMEDALITFRYARNLALGYGFVFNPGEPVLGTTTPLLTLILAAGSGILFGVAAIPLLAKILMISAGILTGAVTYVLMTRLKFPRLAKILAVAAFYLYPRDMITATGGMETPLVLLLMASSLYFLTAGRLTLSALLLALLVLTRIDGLAWTFCVFAAMMFQARRIPINALVVFLALVMPWMLFAMWYFGSPIPLSVTAKQTIGPGGDATHWLTVSNFAVYLRWFASALGGSVVREEIFPLWVLMLAIGARGVWHHARRIALLPIVIFPPLFFAAMYAGRAPTGFEWYLVPVSWCAFILGASGLARVKSRLDEFATRQHLPRALALTAFGLVLLVLAFPLARADVVTFQLSRASQFNEDGLRRKVGEWLKENTPPQARVAMEAVGYQAYYSERAVIDLAGLVSPAVITIYRESSSNADVFNKILRRLAPDYIVLRSYEVDTNSYFIGDRLFETSDQRDYFFSNYQEEHRFAAPLPGVWHEIVSHLTVFRRKQ